MHFKQPFNFEIYSWLHHKETKNSHPVCYINAGYISGWSSGSFGIPLITVELLCKAKGDDICTFVMTHPKKIEETIEKNEKNKYINSI
jgi:two-component system cell cycle sensor histidine kinase/response regulator CckA